MYDNIGGKIKGLAKFFFVVGLIVSLVCGIVLMTLSSGLVLLGLLMIILGGIIAWISTFVLYGFGELVEKTCEIQSVVCINNNPDSSDFVNETALGDHKNIDERKPTIGVCEKCTMVDVELYDCIIEDYFGTRYRKLCKDCIKKTNAKLR